MTVRNPYQSYQKQAVTTSRPEELTFMLYQGLVKYIRLSKIELQNKNLEGSHHNNLRAQNILTELMVTLKAGYEVSDKLMSLYDFMKTRLIEANFNKKVELFDEVEEFALELQKTWSDAMKMNKTKI
ncbi:flagellar export chaperone FliS [Bacillus sp. T3]|uniref:flagellar export chaperone FliS n=1 Tax=Bacillus sp. T3 TaxID=467262 RepID=UPI0029827EA7|nr:flagellar export chaperone FliS [Bacillus sp. T3]